MFISVFWFVNSDLFLLIEGFNAYVVFNYLTVFSQMEQKGRKMWSPYMLPSSTDVQKSKGEVKSLLVECGWKECNYTVWTGWLHDWATHVIMVSRCEGKSRVWKAYLYTGQPLPLYFHLWRRQSPCLTGKKQKNVELWILRFSYVCLELSAKSLLSGADKASVSDRCLSEMKGSTRLNIRKVTRAFIIL